MTARCTHLNRIRYVEPRTPDGCEECLRIGGRWVHLRLCLTCGHVGCCDSSPNRHASRHYHATNHPIVQSFEPNEDWAWCYADRVGLKGADVAAALAASRQVEGEGSEANHPPGVEDAGDGGDGPEI